MKKRIIIVVIIATILVAIISNHKKIYRFYKLNQIRNDCINNINGIFNNRSSEIIKKKYGRYHKSLEELNHYDITKVIEAYINMVNEAVYLYLLRKQNIEIEYEEKDYDLEHMNIRYLEYGKDMQTDGDDLAKYISYDITDEDVNSLLDGAFRKKLELRLMSYLDFEEINNSKIEWQINSTEDKLIELPYNCYIDYTSYHREDNKEFKRAVDIIFSKNFELEKNVNRVKVKYETINGSIKEEEVDLFYVNRNNITYYEISFSNLLIIDADSIAKAKLGSHTADRMIEEESFREYKEWEKIMLN